MFYRDPVLAYFSPETLLPVGSILATVLGVVMMLGRGSWRFLARGFRRVIRPSAWIAGVSRPHFHLEERRDHQSAHAGSSRRAVDPSLPK
jgi:hypothetical protein